MPMKTRAAVLWEQPGKWKVQEVDLDDPGPTEVLVEMVATGLCHSDDHFTAGDMHSPLPIVGGHEGAGIVRSIGAEVHDFAVGDHVLTSFTPACGKCRWCAMGMQNLCDLGANTLVGDQPRGGFRMHSDGKDVGTMAALGTFAEWQVYDQDSLVKIGDDIPLEVACLVACGVQTGFGSATNAAGIQPGDVVLVVGIGGVGINAVQGAALRGAAHVVAVDLKESKHDWALQFGATEFFTDIEQAGEFIASVTNGQGADAAILTTSLVTNAIIGRGLLAIRKAGTLVVTGVSSDSEDGAVPGLNALHLAMFQKRIQGALYGMASPRVAMPMLLNEYRAGRLKLDELITRRYAFDEINEAYDDMREGRNLRGVIEFARVAPSSADSEPALASAH